MINDTLPNQSSSVRRLSQALKLATNGGTSVLHDVSSCVSFIPQQKLTSPLAIWHFNEKQALKKKLLFRFAFYNTICCSLFAKITLLMPTEKITLAVT